MERLTMEYCGSYVPQELLNTDEFGGVDDCDLCFEYCKALEDGNVDCAGCAIDACFRQLGKYENTGLTPEQIAEMDGLYKAKREELAEYKARQDRSPDLDCKIGQEVYTIGLNRDGYVTGAVVSIKITALGISLEIYIPSDDQFIRRAAEQIGRSVFFDQAAAEAALMERKGSGREK